MSFVTQTDQIVFPKGIFKIRKGYLCTSRNVVYTIFCKRCSLKYIGEMGRLLSCRIAEHVRAIKQDKQCPVSRHFNERDNMGIDDMSIPAMVSCTPGRVSLENRLIQE